MVDTSKKSGPEDADEWQPFATFVVEYQWISLERRRSSNLIQFRTYAHGLESGEDEEWTGIEGKPVMEWMLNHVVRQTQGRKSTSDQPNRLTVVEIPVRLDLKEISVIDDLGHCATCLKGGHFSGFVAHDSQLSLKALIDVQGTLTDERIGYCRTDFFAVRLADGKRHSLGAVVPEKEIKEEGKLIASLKDIKLDTGVYAVRAVVVVNDLKPVLDYLEASLLIVA